MLIIEYTVYKLYNVLKSIEAQWIYNTAPDTV